MMAFHSSNLSAAAPPSVAKRIYINFSATDLNLNSKWNDAFGNPDGAVITIANLIDTTGASTGIGFTSISTANWNGYSGNASSDNYNASITGTFYPASATTPTYYRSNWWQYGTASPATYNASLPQMRLTGLNTAKQYTIYMTTVEIPVGQGFDDRGIFRVAGLTTPSAVSIDGDVSTQPSGATFTVLPKVDGTIDIWMNVDNSAGDNLVCVPAIIIVEQDPA